MCEVFRDRRRLHDFHEGTHKQHQNGSVGPLVNTAFAILRIGHDIWTLKRI